ncbi:MAG: LytTR family DNA-binding domain-containing protein [Chloroflexota bacterium]
MMFLLVDDEFPVRQQLQFVLTQLVPEAVFYEASNGDEALLMLAHLDPDVVFLDINMPGRSGLETASLIVDRPNPPLVVFATAHDQYALQAFELAAFDYVVKPFSTRRLTRSITNIRQRIGERKTLAQQKVMIEKFLKESQQDSMPARLWIEQENGNRRLQPYQDIAYIESRAKQTFIHTFDGAEWLARYTLKDLEQRLASHQFCRTHRAYIVNIQAISNLVPWFSGGYQMHLNDMNKSVIPVSRRHVQTVKKLIL